ncbi:MAG: RMD1 family protein [Methylococcales bacterium]
MLNVISFQIADSIDIRAVKKHLTGTLYFEDSDELFYKKTNDRFLYIFKFGVVCFFGVEQNEITACIHEISAYAKNPIDERLSEEFEVETHQEGDRFGYNRIYLSEPTPEAIQIIMLNVSQSVALDYYSELSRILLEETRRYTHMLENKGRLSISGKNLSKVIGRTLNLKNSIAENLYIFDNPIMVWDNERLDKLHAGLKTTFDITMRYRAIVEELVIVKENLDLFKDLMLHRQSSFLEWIIIALILVEVLNLLGEKVF